MAATVGNYQESPAQLFHQGLFENSATQKHRLGTRRTLDDGRSFIYCSNTAAQLAAGVCISKVQTPQDCTVAAADVTLGGAVGSKKVSLTLTGAPTLNLYKDGLLVLTAGAGIGEMYKVKGNTVDDVPASGRCTFYLYDAVKTLWVAASTTAAVYQNPCSSLLVNPAVANEDAVTQELVMGVTTQIVAASKYFWAQTRGMAAMLLDVDTAAGSEANEMCVVQGTTAGRGAVIIPLETTFFWGTQILAHIFEAADLTDAEASLVNLCIS